MLVLHLYIRKPYLNIKGNLEDSQNWDLWSQRLKSEIKKTLQFGNIIFETKVKNISQEHNGCLDVIQMWVLFKITNYNLNLHSPYSVMECQYSSRKLSSAFNIKKPADFHLSVNNRDNKIRAQIDQNILEQLFQVLTAIPRCL